MAGDGTGTEARGARLSRARWRRLAERLGLVCLGLVFALVALEGLLQIGAAYVRETAYDRSSEWVGPARRILCLGDSNTYGTMVRRPHAYPEVLKKLWNGQAGRTEVDVLNLGIPGMNSSKLRNNFGGLVASFRPDIALVLVGANDLWTVPAPEAPETPLTLEQRLWQRSRVFRLLYMVARAVRGVERPPEVIVTPDKEDGPGKGVVRLGEKEFDLTWTGGTSQRQRGWNRRLRVNLEAMRKVAEENRIRLVLLTYASHLHVYGLANEVIRAARADDLPVIDLERVFTAICPDGKCPDVFLPDGHPNQAGYQIVAATIWREIARLDGRPPEPRNAASWNRTLAPEVRRRLASATDDAS